MVDQLSKYIDLFYKRAGTLKVSDKLLKEVSDYIVGCYCAHIGEDLGKLIKTYTKRGKIFDQAEDKLLLWEELYYLCKGIKQYTGTGEELSLLDDLVKLSAENDFTLPKIDMRKQDRTGLDGVSLPGDAAFFRFEKSSGAYRLDYFVDINKNSYHSSEEDGEGSISTAKFDISKSDLSALEAAKLITEIIDNDKFSTPHIYLKSLRRNYDGDRASSATFSDMKVVYGFCLKASANIKDDVAQVFSVPNELFSFSNKIKNQDISVKARLVDNKLRPFIYKTEDWMGLWDSTNSEVRHKNIMLGTVYVAADLDNDAKKIESLADLKKKLDVLKQTTRHELQHFMQTAMSYLISGGASKEFGLPSRKIRETEQKQPPTGQSEKTYSSHALRDVEFYTRLSDNIDEYNRVKTELPVPLHNLLRRGFIKDISSEEFKSKLLGELRVLEDKSMQKDPRWSGYSDMRKVEFLERSININTRQFRIPYEAVVSDNFFAKLKEHQPAKYRKAVIEFLKAIS